MLARWFTALPPAAAGQGGILSQSAAAARDLLVDPRETCVLHGDVHHGNVLDFGARGWLAIDPKGLVGERGFDYANLFCNPERATAAIPGRLARQVAVAAGAAGLERRRLLRWILARSGLSAAWSLDDGTSPRTALAVVALAAAVLEDCQRFRMQHLAPLPGVRSLVTEIPLKQVKATTALPVRSGDR